MTYHSPTDMKYILTGEVTPLKNYVLPESKAYLPIRMEVKTNINVQLYTSKETFMKHINLLQSYKTLKKKMNNIIGAFFFFFK